MSFATAACAHTDVDPDWFFNGPDEDEDTVRLNSHQPRKHAMSEDIMRAKAVCSGCPIRNYCLTSHEEDPYAVVGGTTPRERFNIRRGRAPVGSKVRQRKAMAPAETVDYAVACLAAGVSLEAITSETGISGNTLGEEVQRRVLA